MGVARLSLRRSRSIACFLLCTVVLLASPPTARPSDVALTESWAHTLGGSADDAVNGITVDRSGNVYLAGQTSSFGAGGYDVLLLKYSPSGILLCRQTWGGSGSDAASDIALDASGSFVYVAGWTASSSSGNQDALLAKFDANCNFVWAQSWDLGGRETVRRVEVNPIDGSLVLGGVTRIGTNQDDALLMKVSDPGATPPQAPAWGATWSMSWEGVNDLFFGVDGRIYACGQTIPPSGYGIDAYLARYDSSGNLEWVKTWNRAANDSASSCTSDQAGNIYVTGQTGPWAANSGQDVYLLKFDPTGNLLWSKTWDGGGTEFSARVVTSPDSEIYVVGGTGSYPTHQDALLLQYDASGTLLRSSVRRADDLSYALAAAAGPAGLVIGGTAPNNSGSWQDFAGTPGTGPTAAAPQSPSRTFVSLSQTDVVGTSNTPSGVEDTGGGGFDAFVASLGTEQPSIELTKAANPLTYDAVGRVINYTLVATNTGNIPLTDVSISDPGLLTLACAPTPPTTLAPGAALTCNGSYSITQADLDAGQVANTATSTGNGPLGEPVSASATATATALPRPAIVLGKTANPTAYSKAGDVIAYAMVATNTGNVTLTNVLITDPMLGALSCAPAQPARLAPGDTVKCSGSRAITPADMKAGAVINSATVDCNPPSGSPLSAASTATVTAANGQKPGLVLTKAAQPPTFNASVQVISYTMVATNTGNVTLTDVAIADPTLNALTCSPLQPVTLVPGGTLMCTGDHTVTNGELKAGAVTNAATAEGTPPHGNTVSAKAAVTVLATWRWPVDDAKVGQPYACRDGKCGVERPSTRYTDGVNVHTGVDVSSGTASSYSTVVRAAAGGWVDQEPVVYDDAKSHGLGNAVILRHPGGPIHSTGTWIRSL